MHRNCKYLGFIILASLAIVSIAIMKGTVAQSTLKPSVPEFTVKLVPSQGSITITDPLTGANNTINFDNSTIQITIKNQLFSSYKDVNGNFINLYYNVSEKGPYGNWKYYPTSVQKYAISNSEHTVLTFLTNDMNRLQQNSAGIQADVIPTPVGELDFQVQACIGYYSIAYGFSGSSFPSQIEVFNGETSDWSNIQTINIGETSASASPNPTLAPISTITQTSAPTPTPVAPDTTTESFSVPLTAFIGVVAVFVVIVFSLLLLLYRRSRKT
jgi:hypothetical protein